MKFLPIALLFALAFGPTFDSCFAKLQDSAEQKKEAASEEASEKEEPADADSEEDSKTEPKGNAVEGRADVLIITDESLASAWQKFADWKTSTGRPAKIVTTDFIEDEFSGDDIQQKIRACCLEHIDQEQTKWVVLGGDSNGDAGIVPDRDTDHSECQMLPYDNIPTDLYYISEKDWDANDDGVYGVFEDDMEEVEYFNPTASIGRIPVRTEDDVLAYTEKVIAYESRYPVGDFARRMIYTCPAPEAQPKLATSITEVGEIWNDGYISRFFDDQSPWDDQEAGEYDLSPSNWAKMLNDRQASKIHMHGHGLLNLWVLEKDRTVRKSHVSKLTNKNAYPIITTVSCLTGQYDNKKDPCIAESMLRQPEAGAIVILAPSREGVPFMKKQSDFRLMMTEGKMDGTTTAYTRFWKNALGEKNLTVGEAFRQVKIEMESDARENDGFHMCQCELNLLGDPSLAIHRVPPTNFKVRYRMSKNTVKLRGIPGAKVCVWDGAGQHHMVEASKRGSAQVKIKPTTGKYHITVVAPGYNVWSKTVEKKIEDEAVAASKQKKDSDEDATTADSDENDSDDERE